MDIKFLKQFKLTPVQGLWFDNYCYGLACKKIRNFTGGQWNTAKVGDLIVLLPPSQGDTLTMGAAYSDVTADRLTVGAAFTLLLVNWYWNEMTDSLTDEQNEAFSDYYFGLRDAVWADNPNHTIDTGKFFDLTD